LLSFVPVFLLAIAAPIPLPEPANSILAVQAGGVQIYRCDATASPAPKWVLDHPEAALFRDDGSAFGRHTTGPSWIADDGSRIVGDGAAPITVMKQPDSVPWLLLRITMHSGTGILQDARFVERYDTRGGLAPSAETCDLQHSDQRRAVHYSAVYEFFK